jgi:hypothetical protein
MLLVVYQLLKQQQEEDDQSQDRVYQGIYKGQWLSSSQGSHVTSRITIPKGGTTETGGEGGGGGGSVHSTL